MDQVLIPPGEPEAPKIMLGFVRNVKSGELDQVRCVPLTPGMRIKRMGKLYEVDAKGTQRRVEG